MFTYYFHKFTLISTRVHVVNSNIMDISLGQELNSQEKFNTKNNREMLLFLTLIVTLSSLSRKNTLVGLFLLI